MSIERKGTFSRPSQPSLAYTLHLSSAAPHHAKLALLAHPLGRLGGSQQDHLIVSLSRTLVQEGYAVLRYDARGSGGSEGSASWSCLPEAEDFQAILRAILLPLLPPSTNVSSAHLLLAGYSAGSLPCVLCPSPSNLHLRTSRLLVSYPLSVLWALTAFRSSTFTSALKDLVASSSASTAGEAREGGLLEIHGDSDQFTAVGKYQAWSDDLARCAAGVEGEQQQRWKSVEVAGADHFWREREVKGRVLQEVVQWVREEAGRAQEDSSKRRIDDE